MIASLLLSGAVLLAGAPKDAKADEAEVRMPTVNNLGQMPDGSPIDIYTMHNGPLTVRILTLGGIVTVLQAPDRSGKRDDIVLGFDKLADYQKPHPYFGAIVGRVANRVANARFTLGGKLYKLFPNNDPHSLHGGKVGFDKVNWEATPGTGLESPYLELKYTSPDGEEGYPGELQTKVTYWLHQNALQIDYEAITDKPTPVNLSHHSYFNLAGQGNGDILGHEIQIEADEYTPVGPTLIPTGKIAGVQGTPLDLSEPVAIGKGIVKLSGKPGGYDHNFVLRRTPGGQGVRKVARVREPKSGRVMEVHTDQPGLQFYTGNFLDGTLKGKGGKVYEKHAGFCLEAQHYPDSPNQPAFPSVILEPGDVYKQTTVYRFYVDKQKP